MKKSSKRTKVALWEWIVSFLITFISGVVVWTNETVDFLTKLGITLSYGQTIIIFSIIFFFGLSWILTIILRKKGLI
jgi:hypothetical protein